MSDLKGIREDIWRAEDMVNHPPHYTQGKVECIDAMEASMEPKEFAGYLKGCVIKYVWRFEKKWDALEDLDKADFYLDRLRQFMKKHPDIFKEDLTIKVDNPSRVTTRPLDMPPELVKLEKMLEGTPNEVRVRPVQG